MFLAQEVLSAYAMTSSSMMAVLTSLQYKQTQINLIIFPVELIILKSWKYILTICALNQVNAQIKQLNSSMLQITIYSYYICIQTLSFRSYSHLPIERYALPGNGLDDKDGLASNRLFHINSSLWENQKSGGQIQLDLQVGL